jgi:phosphate transport system substrate-binding protein
VRSVVTLAVAMIVFGTLACGAGPSAEMNAGGRPAATRSAIRVTGSDTMVNLVQSWAERYRSVRPDVAVQIAGGGTGVGITALVEGLADIAAASREMTDDERERVAHGRSGPLEFTVALDALAVYVDRTNPLDAIALEDLAEIYGDGGRIERWSQLAIANGGCPSDRIIRVGRQNSSGTYAYFREAVLGHRREYKLGSIDQSGSKDVVALVSNTPCAIGYSGMAYATPDVKVLRIARIKGTSGVAPTAASAADGCYPIARRLYLYTRGRPTDDVQQFIEWIRGPAGQAIVGEIGFVPVASSETESP